MDYFLISNMYPDTNSPGYGSFVRNVVDGLSQNGMNCKYSALIVGKPSSFLQKCIKYLMFYICILKHYFKKYDFLYIHYPNHALPCLIPCYFIKKQKIIINLHGEDLLYKNNGVSSLLGKLNDFFLKKADAVVVPSDYFKNIVIERINDATKEIIVSPSGGIDAKRFPPKTFSKDTGSIMHIGYVGRIDPNKGWREFMDTIVLLKKSIKFKATIIGYGSEVSQLQSLLSSNNFDSVDYIPKVPQESLSKYYSCFDLLIFPSMRKEESLGLVGIEAMACGTPVVGSNIGGIPSYLKHGYNGYLVAPGNINEIVNYIIEYSQLNSSQKELLYTNCLETSKNYFSERVIKDLSVSFARIAIKQ